MRWLIVILAMVAVRKAHGEPQPFLYLPFDKQIKISCDFCCYATDIGTCHSAIDFSVPHHSKVYAVAMGTVELVKDGMPLNKKKAKSYGNYIRIVHPNGYKTIYAHLAPGKILVEEGKEVDIGQQIAESDNTGQSTGPHLHFEVRDPAGKKVNPYGDKPQYPNCGKNALWVSCPPEPYKAPEPPKVVDADNDGVPKAQDCNDNDPGISPEAKEPCDGVDNNCNGVIDDPWKKELATDLGKPCVVNVTGCDSYGTWVCAPNGAGVFCDAVLIEPTVETCDGDDNDCDGIIDNAWPALNQVCYKQGAGSCLTTKGTYQCTPDGTGTYCNALDPKKPDCTGKVCGPDGCGGSCGECAQGFVCGTDGGACICDPASEICDFKDNDCDGETDEGFGVGIPCTVGKGVCEALGALTCDLATGKVLCTAEPGIAEKEVCDDLKDNDCDGLTDEWQLWKPDSPITLMSQNYLPYFLRLRFNSATGKFALIHDDGGIFFHELSQNGSVLGGKMIVDSDEWTTPSAHRYEVVLTPQGYALAWRSSETEIRWLRTDHAGNILTKGTVVTVPYPWCQISAPFMAYHPNGFYAFSWTGLVKPPQCPQASSTVTILNEEGAEVAPPFNISLPKSVETHGPVLAVEEGFVALFGTYQETWFTTVDLGGKTVQQFTLTQSSFNELSLNDVSIAWNSVNYGMMGSTEFWVINALGKLQSSFVSAVNFGGGVNNPHIVWNGKEYAVAGVSQEPVSPWDYVSTGIAFGRTDGVQWLGGTPFVLSADEDDGLPSVAWDGSRYAVAWNQWDKILLRFIECQ